jgi:hypothetical protein
MRLKRRRPERFMERIKLLVCWKARVQAPGATSACNLGPAQLVNWWGLLSATGFMSGRCGDLRSLTVPSWLVCLLGIQNQVVRVTRDSDRRMIRSGHAAP